MDEENDNIQITISYKDRSYKTSAASFLGTCITKAIIGDRLELSLKCENVEKSPKISIEEEIYDTFDEACDDAEWTGDLYKLISHGLKYSQRLSIQRLSELVAALKLYAKLGQEILDTEAREELDEDIEEWAQDWYAYPVQFK